MDIYFILCAITTLLISLYNLIQFGPLGTLWQINNQDFFALLYFITTPEDVSVFPA